MDFGLIALIGVGVGKLLDYVAPRTKTKIDDKIRDGFGYVIGFLPFFNKKLADEVNKAEQDPLGALEGQVDKVLPPEPAITVTVMPDGSVVRDHRS